MFCSSFRLDQMLIESKAKFDYGNYQALAIFSDDDEACVWISRINSTYRDFQYGANGQLIADEPILTTKPLAGDLGVWLLRSNTPAWLVATIYNYVEFLDKIKMFGTANPNIVHNNNDQEVKYWLKEIVHDTNCKMRDQILFYLDGQRLIDSRMSKNDSLFEEWKIDPRRQYTFIVDIDLLLNGSGTGNRPVVRLLPQYGFCRFFSSVSMSVEFLESRIKEYDCLILKNPYVYRPDVDEKETVTAEVTKDDDIKPIKVSRRKIKVKENQKDGN